MLYELPLTMSYTAEMGQDKFLCRYHFGKLTIYWKSKYQSIEFYSLKSLKYNMFLCTWCFFVLLWRLIYVVNVKVTFHLYWNVSLWLLVRELKRNFKTSFHKYMWCTLWAMSRKCSVFLWGWISLNKSVSLNLQWCSLFEVAPCCFCAHSLWSASKTEITRQH